MGRHEQREQIFMLLFREEFHSAEDMPEQVKLFFEDNETVVSKKDADYISRRYELIREKIPEIDIIPKNDTFCLIEVRAMSSIHLIISETADDTEVLARNLCLGKLMGRKDGSLASEDLAACELMIECIAPAS